MNGRARGWYTTETQRISLPEKTQVNLSHYVEERQAQCPGSPTSFVGSSDLSGYSFTRTR
jgi:hypothetical protein